MRKVYNLVAGVGEALPSDVTFWDGTYNVYRDGQRLVNYPGKTDIFRRLDEYPANIGSPPPIVLHSITRIISFTDSYGKDHLVFVLCKTVSGMKIAYVSEKEGNGYTTIVALRGENIDGKYFPCLFMHENKLIIANPGDPVYVWDGQNGPEQLGVTEAPLPPTHNVTPAPVAGVVLNYDTWSFRNFWWPGFRPPSGPAANKRADGTTESNGIYEVATRFIDRYGNRGPMSAPCLMAVVPSQRDETTTKHQNTDIHYLCVDVSPPMRSENVHAIAIYRTANLNSDGGAGVRGVMYRETDLSPTEGRATLRKYDSTLMLSETAVEWSGPKPSRIGVSWKNRVWLVVDDVVQYSEKALFGQFGPINYYRCRSYVTALVPLGDKLWVVGESSSAILYETSTGVIMVLEELPFGSRHGRSIAVYKDTAFGIIDGEFSAFDGNSLTRVGAPFYISGDYIDFKQHMLSSTVDGDTYFLSCRIGAESTEPSHVIMFDFAAKMFFLLKESCYDIMPGGLCCLDSIYQMFLGTPAQAEIVMNIGGDMEYNRSINEITLRLKPSVKNSASFVVYGDGGSEAKSVEVLLIDSPNVVDKKDRPNSVWDTTALPAKWSSPMDVFVRCVVQRGVSGYVHRIHATLPAGANIELSSLIVDFSEPVRQI